MKAFACIVLFAVAALAAPEGKRDKRGFLHGGYSSGYELGHSSFGHGSYDHGSFGHGSFDHGSFGHGSFGHSSLDLGHGLHGAILEPVYSAPAKIVSVSKVVEVPRVVEVKKIVSVPKVVSVPQIVKVSKIVEEPHYGHVSSGWW